MNNSAIKNAAILALFACLATALVMTTLILTRDIIAKEQQKALEVYLNQVIPKHMYNNELHQSCVTLINPNQPKKNNHQHVHIAKNDNTTVAYAIETVTNEGYSGDISMIIGVNSSFEILGVRTLEHQETPGLGDAIERKKSNWVESFIGHSINSTSTNAWAVKKDGGQFDQFTGATITPRAYIKAIKEALLFLKSRHHLLSTSPSC